LPPVAMLDGSAESILKDRDRKLEQARKRRHCNHLATKKEPLTCIIHKISPPRRYGARKTVLKRQLPI